jgi:hypothetical protein
MCHKFKALFIGNIVKAKHHNKTVNNDRDEETCPFEVILID